MYDDNIIENNQIKGKNKVKNDKTCSAHDTVKFNYKCISFIASIRMEYYTQCILFSSKNVYISVNSVIFHTPTVSTMNAQQERLELYFSST